MLSDADLKQICGLAPKWTGRRITQKAVGTAAAVTQLSGGGSRDHLATTEAAPNFGITSAQTPAADR